MDRLLRRSAKHRSTEKISLLPMLYNFVERVSFVTDRLAPIRIAAAVISDTQGRTLLVKKRNTNFFMQPGGKLEPGETPTQTLARELQEELGCTLITAEFLGQFSAPAANEPPRIVEALIYFAEIAGPVTPGAEIDEFLWVDPNQTAALSLAPLTRDHVIPLILSGRVKAATP
jgi:8-oxo-dGTP diphosphatase